MSRVSTLSCGEESRLYGWVLKIMLNVSSTGGRQEVGWEAIAIAQTRKRRLKEDRVSGSEGGKRFESC